MNPTSSTLEDAADTKSVATAAGARYLDGKIMVRTPLIGSDDALVPYSGDAALFDEHRAALSALGGEADLLGAGFGLAAVYDLASSTCSSTG